MEATSTEDISSIYDDLVGQGDLGLVIHNLESRNKLLRLHVTSLEEDISKLCNKITEMKRTQENLSRNISELYKTAKNEIERKDRAIAELQSKLDDFVFRRNTAPSNFNFKRQREDVLHSEETHKRVRYDIKSEQNRDQNKGNTVHQNELSKSDHYNVKKGEFDGSKNYRTSDTRDDMKHKNIARNDDKKFDYRDNTRYDRDRQSLNSRNNRRDNERSSKRYSDKDRRSSRDREYKFDRFGESRDPRYRNVRNEKQNRDKDHKYDDREYMGRNREVKHEPRFSSIESTRSTPDSVVEVDCCLNVSREEGEISDFDADLKQPASDKTKYNIRTGINIPEKNINLCDIKKDPPGDKINSLSESKNIDKNKNVSKKKEVEVKSIARNNKREKLTSEINRQCEENLAEDTKHKVQEKSEHNIEITKNATKKETLGITEKSWKSIEESDVKTVSLINDDSMELQVKSGVMKEVKTEKITIISQVVLNEAKSENIESKANSKEVVKPETILKELGCTMVNKIVKVDKPIRECGVPRNLTGELDINIDKLRLGRSKVGELDAEKSERIEKKMSSLFDTPVKVDERSLDKSVDSEQIFDIKHDGSKPETERTNAKEPGSLQSTVDIETSTPVSEFQFFKKNLHNLEKSNDTITQLQTDVSNITVNTAEIPTHIVTESVESNIDGNKNVEEDAKQNISEGLPNLISEELIDVTQPVKNEKMSCVNISDMSNLSLDLLNTNFAMCKAEDFPNLTSCTESTDMPNILSTTISNSSEKDVNNEQDCSKSKGFENNSKKPSVSKNTVVDEKVILKGNITNEEKLSVPSNITTHDTVNTPASLNSGNTKRKRKRCTIGWV